MATVSTVLSTKRGPPKLADAKFTRRHFPGGFVFGAATSSYQVEGAYRDDGKGESNWDAYTYMDPEKIQDGSNGNVAIDHYHKYREDVIVMKKLGLDAYRFSISWPRLLPTGRLSGGVNRKGVEFYNNLIDFCLSHDIEPYVTLFHFELPQALEDDYGGFLNPRIIQDFVDFAELCFWEFGDRVKHWTTINEPWTFAHNSYVTGAFPPGLANAKPLEYSPPAAAKLLQDSNKDVNVDKKFVKLAGKNNSSVYFTKTIARAALSKQTPYRCNPGFWARTTGDRDPAESVNKHFNLPLAGHESKNTSPPASDTGTGTGTGTNGNVDKSKANTPARGVTNGTTTKTSAQPTITNDGNNVDALKTSAPTVSPSVISVPGVDPYKAAHHMILAHARAVKIYRDRYQANQKGKIGITNMTTWFKPLHEDNIEDQEAAKRALEFMFGWFMRPIVHGDYPKVMKDRVKERLQDFSPEEKELIKGSYDFIGINYYTTTFVVNATKESLANVTGPTYYTDQSVCTTPLGHDGNPIGECPGVFWLYIVPKGIYNLLVHVKDEYEDPAIYITENGMSEINDHDHKKLSSHVLHDDVRVNFYKDHLSETKKAIADGVNVKGYFLWSMFDNYEWSDGYQVRFGIFYVDFKRHLARYPKNSAIWWMNFLESESDLCECEGPAKHQKRIRDI